ncbi:cell division cycle protein 123 homolog isoform X2 [Homarus americanus]|uniref:cell division cycle protein 123 homolog isoform X2 n=1 Tax=Homarus americanus TaxID=6706 RepID=UPI001C48D3EE|nr:cell division cycle protein 123 homolog isoform X2 [Homarus americanus]
MWVSAVSNRLSSNAGSILLPLTPEVLAYMQDNGTLVLPEGSQPEPTYKRNTQEEEDTEDWDLCETSGCVVQGPKLEEYSTKIRDAIKKLGGSAFPKLNWSSPKDATWIALNSSLRCYTPGDVYLLLKSSNFVTHDLTTPFKDCDDVDVADPSVDYCLVLRRWMEINPAYEFRCFVRNKELVGISQRDISQGYSCVGGDQVNIRNDIISFWRENIDDRFPLHDYVVDVYRPVKDHVILLDFNPFGETTDGLLFSWPELKGLEDFRECLSRVIGDETSEEPEDNIQYHNERNVTDSNLQSYSPQRDKLICSSLIENSPEFRFISDATGVQPSPHKKYGLPMDIVDLSTIQDPKKLIDIIQMVRKYLQYIVKQHYNDDERKSITAEPFIKQLKVAQNFHKGSEFKLIFWNKFHYFMKA